MKTWGILVILLLALVKISTVSSRRLVIDRNFTAACQEATDKFALTLNQYTYWCPCKPITMEFDCEGEEYSATYDEVVQNNATYIGECNKPHVTHFSPILKKSVNCQCATRQFHFFCIDNSRTDYMGLVLTMSESFDHLKKLNIL